MFVYTVTGLVSLLLAIRYKMFYFNKDFNETLTNPKKYLMENFFTLVIFICNALVVGILKIYDHISFFGGFEFLFLLNTVWIVSEIDLEDRIIPNQIILFLFISRIMFLLLENLQKENSLNRMIISTFIGLLIGGGVIFILKILSGNGLGSGDVKLFAMIGFFVGENMIFKVLFYTFVIVFLIGVFLFFTKKMTLKDTIPLAPFAFLSLLFYFPIKLILG